MWRFLFIVQLLLFLFPSLVSAKTTLVITNQEGFDNIQQQVLLCISDGETDINVKIKRGVYIVKENHLLFNKINAPDVTLRIIGKEAILIPEGREYRDGDYYIGTFNVNNSWMNGDKDVETWSHIQYADGLIEVLDVSEKQCRLKTEKTFTVNTNFSNVYILIPHWYQSSIYKIDKIEEQYIYFTADDLKESTYGGYNVNDDYNYGKKGIRYKLCNVEIGEDYLRIIEGKVRLPNNVISVREGKTNSFLTIQNSNFAMVEIAGIHIRGNACRGSKPAIYIKNSECTKLRVRNCFFSGMRGDVISIDASSNVSIEANRFENCYNCGIKSDNASANTFVENNVFVSMGKRMSNTPCVRCRGTDYKVSANTFFNFGYCGISTGAWYKSNYKQKCCGVIEYNDLSFRQDYLDDIDNYGIMDGGAIYIATKNDGSIVRYNYIHGFSGVKSNRGVFCDDGAYNVEIYGNVITGIANSRCIDSRRVAKVESVKTPKSNIDQANVNVVIRDNIIDGAIRFEANESLDNGCIKGLNYILISKECDLSKNVIKNVVNPMDDVFLEYNGVKKERIGLSPKSYRMIRHSPLWVHVRDYLVIKC